MSDLVFAVPEPVLLPVSDGRSFPVRRIFCVGRFEAKGSFTGEPNFERPPVGNVDDGIVDHLQSSQVQQRIPVGVDVSLPVWSFVPC